MARNDYHVVVYQILAYLYTKLKDGEPVDAEMLKPGSQYLAINERYWLYVMENLLNDGLISGINVTRPFGRDRLVSNLEYCEITPKGIEYLCDNSFLEKAKRFLIDTKAIVPFI